MTIRAYQESDREDLLDVWSSASMVAHPFLGDDFHNQERSTIRNVYLPAAETWVWVAQENIQGFISLLGNEIGGLFVAPLHHRTGIGSALLDHARLHYGVLEVEVFEENTIGRSFYAKQGFRLISKSIHVVTGFTALRLILDVK